MYRLKLLLVLAVVVVPAACASRAAKSIALYRAGDYAGAAKVAEAGLADHPKDSDLWGMRIRAALALGDGDGVAKAYATYAAHGGDDDKALLSDLADATLEQALDSPSTRLQIAAIDTIADIRIIELADLVAEKLGAHDDRVAASAAVAVLRDYQHAPEVADDMLRSENAEARRIAVDGVGKKVGKLAAADLEKAASDPDARVRTAALRWLGVIRDRDAVTVCTRRLHDPDESVRAVAASALARIGLGNLEELGKQALSDKALGVRLAGIELLEAAHRDDELVALAADPDPIVAVTAAIAVKPRHGELATPAIERAIASDDPHVRAGAANLLVRAVGRDGALAFARKLAGDPDPDVQLAAARVLAHAGDRELARKLFTGQVGSRQSLAALTDLVELDPSAADQLSTWIRDPKQNPERRVAVAAAHRSAHVVTPGLVAALADPSGLVRVEAAAALAARAK